jgi:hypothetical protein
MGNERRRFCQTTAKQQLIETAKQPNSQQQLIENSASGLSGGHPIAAASSARLAPDPPRLGPPRLCPPLPASPPTRLAAQARLAPDPPRLA